MKDSSLASLERLVFRDTARKLGRHLHVTPKNSALEHLCYGRTRLAGATTQVEFETGRCEVGLICMSGLAEVVVDGQARCLAPCDALYAPRGSVVRISSEAADLVEVAAEVDGHYPLQVVRYAEVLESKALHFWAGGSASRRELNVLLGANIRAGRIMAGFTRSEPGHWTSWPPHEHGAMLEELYLYFDMPAPAFGMQFVFTDRDTPELAVMVREGDAVAMPAGYHPNVAIPGHPINFVWLMAARRERDDRKFGVVNVLPELSGGGSGLEAGTGRR
jgi:5-deoxy-glucuronate isomerase